MTAREMATGLPAGKNSSVEAGDDKTVLACFEEGLRYRKPSRKIGHPLHDSFAEATCAPAEGSGVIGLALRRWRRQAEATEFRQRSNDALASQRATLNTSAGAGGWPRSMGC